MLNSTNAAYIHANAVSRLGKEEQVQSFCFVKGFIRILTCSRGIVGLQLLEAARSVPLGVVRLTEQLFYPEGMCESNQLPSGL